MKKIRMIMLAVFAIISMSASAQEPFATFYAQYNPTYLKYDKSNKDFSDYYNGITIGYNYATPFFGIPLYLEFGGAAQWSFRYKDGYSTNLIALKVPVNVLFSINVSDAFKIQPYGGVYGRFFLLGKTKPDYQESINWFSYYDDAKRFQMGLNAGVKFVISDFTIGGGYYYDFMKIRDHYHFEGFDITLGMVL